MSRKPKLLIIGHGRHGKDTVAQMISDKMKLTFASSSDFVGRRAIWPTWGRERYSSFEKMFEARITPENRVVWGNLISAYNTPDKSRTASEMLKEGNDMYIGMRRIAEWEACMGKELFDHVIWVDASKRLPPEAFASNELTAKQANLYIDNNGPEANLEVVISNLQEKLDGEGFDVNYVKYVKPYDEDGNYVHHTTTYVVGQDLHTVAEASPDPEPSEHPYCVACGLYHPQGAVFSCSQELKKLAPDTIEPIPYTGVDTQPQLENRLEWTDKPENAIEVLDHGFFEVKEVMGSDVSIAESARMSYGRGTKKVNNDEGLINYLVRNHHTSPLEMGEIKFHMRMPIFVMRQMVRHRTANLNEYSGRYSEMVRLFYTPELSKIMCQGTVNKQMSGEPLPEEEAQRAQNIIRESANHSFDDYEILLKSDVSRETARIVLPLNTYTEVVWKLDVSNLIKFLYLRDDDHAQWEIRVYAKLIAEAVEHFFPLVYAAYLRTRESVSLTQDQITAIIMADTSGLSKGEAAQVTAMFAKLDVLEALSEVQGPV